MYTNEYYQTRSVWCNTPYKTKRKGGTIHFVDEDGALCIKQVKNMEPMPRIGDSLLIDRDYMGGSSIGGEVIDVTHHLQSDGLQRFVIKLKTPFDN